MEHTYHSSNPRKPGLTFKCPTSLLNSKHFASAANSEALNCEHPNASLLNLGVILLEIHEWKPTEPKAEDHAPNGDRDANTVFRAATLFFDELRDHLQPNWRKAIHYCLYPREFYRDESRLQDDEVRKGIYDNIIAPLEREYQNLLTSP
jgi:hypothetical protein